MRRDSVARLIKGQAGVVWTEIPRLQIPTTTPTYRLGSPSTPFDTEASFTSVDQYGETTATTATAASRGATSLDFSGGLRSIRGHAYLVVDATTGTPVRVTAAKTSGSVDPFPLAEPLPMDIASGSQFDRLTIGVDVSSAVTSDEGSGLVEWSATFDDPESDNPITVRWVTPFVVVERGGSYTLTGDVLTTSSPFSRQLGTAEDLTFEETIDAAWRLHVRPALLAQQIRIEDIVSMEELEPAHIAAVELFLAGSSPSIGTDVIEQKRRSFADAMQMLLQSRHLWVSTESQELTPPVANEARPWITTQVYR